MKFGLSKNLIFITSDDVIPHCNYSNRNNYNNKNSNEINSMSELIYSIDNNWLLVKDTQKNIYEKLIKDMSKTQENFNKWWENMQKKYCWESIVGYSHQIKFQTSEIILSKN